MPFYTFDIYSVKTHTTNQYSVFFHPVQNVLLISDFLIQEDEVDQIVKKIADDKGGYHIQEPELEFDVFIRKGPILLHRAYSPR